MRARKFAKTGKGFVLCGKMHGLLSPDDRKVVEVLNQNFP